MMYLCTRVGCLQAHSQLCVIDGIVYKRVFELWLMLQSAVVTC